MFQEVLMIGWSTISLFLGATFYVELLKHNDFLYQQKGSLLSRFPLHTTQCCENGCRNPISHGYTLENYASREEEFLSYLALSKIRIFSKIFFKNQSITLWKGEVLGNQGFIHPSAVKETHFYCDPYHNQGSHEVTLSHPSSSSNNTTETYHIAIPIMKSKPDVIASMWMELFDTTNQSNKAPKIHSKMNCSHLNNVSCENISYLVSLRLVHLLDEHKKNFIMNCYMNQADVRHSDILTYLTNKTTDFPSDTKKTAQSLDENVKYPVAIANQENSSFELIHYFLYGFIFSGMFGVAAILYTMFLQCSGFIWMAAKCIPTRKGSEENVLIPVKTLHFFKQSLELVIQHKNIHFERAQQYFKIGLQVNLEKNLLSAENSALKRELTCLKAKLTNQRFYIQMLEKANEEVSDKVRNYNTGKSLLDKAIKEQLQHIECSTKSEDLLAKENVKAEENVVQSLEDADQHLSSDDSQLTVAEEDLPHMETDEVNQCCTSDESNSNLSEKEIPQKRRQICLEVSEIIHHEKRLNEIMFPGGKLPLNFVIKLPTPKIHWLPPTNPHIIVLTGQNALSTSQSYPGASSASSTTLITSRSLTPLESAFRIHTEKRFFLKRTLTHSFQLPSNLPFHMKKSASICTT